MEAGESAPDACARECREELGIEVAVGRHVYDGGTIAPGDLAHRGADPEVNAVVLVEPADLDSVTIPRLANRIRGALAAREIRSLHEAVDGRPRHS